MEDSSIWHNKKARDKKPIKNSPIENNSCLSELAILLLTTLQLHCCIVSQGSVARKYIFKPSIFKDAFLCWLEDEKTCDSTNLACHRSL